MTVQELEKAVAKLSPEELAEFRAWFQQFDMDEWDRQIARDSESGNSTSSSSRRGAITLKDAAGSCETLRNGQLLAMLRRTYACASAFGGRKFRSTQIEPKASVASVQENGSFVVGSRWTRLPRIGY